MTDKWKFIIDNSYNFRETVAKKVTNTLTKDEFNTLNELLHKVDNEIIYTIKNAIDYLRIALIRNLF